MGPPQRGGGSATLEPEAHFMKVFMLKTAVQLRLQTREEEWGHVQVQTQREPHLVRVERREWRTCNANVKNGSTGHIIKGEKDK